VIEMRVFVRRIRSRDRYAPLFQQFIERAATMEAFYGIGIGRRDAVLPSDD
jgi:hypothetical protein